MRKNLENQDDEDYRWRIIIKIKNKIVKQNSGKNYSFKLLLNKLHRKGVRRSGKCLPM